MLLHESPEIHEAEIPGGNLPQMIRRKTPNQTRNPRVLETRTQDPRKTEVRPANHQSPPTPRSPVPPNQVPRASPAQNQAPSPARRRMTLPSLSQERGTETATRHQDLPETVTGEYLLFPSQITVLAEYPRSRDPMDPTLITRTRGEEARELDSEGKHLLFLRRKQNLCLLSKF